MLYEVITIHLFDGDTFLQHNAFRSPGAADIDKLRERVKKTDYFKDIYTNMHRKIISHVITSYSIHYTKLYDSEGAST